MQSVLCTLLTHPGYWLLSGEKELMKAHQAWRIVDCRRRHTESLRHDRKNQELKEFTASAIPKAIRQNNTSVPLAT